MHKASTEMFPMHILGPLCIVLSIVLTWRLQKVWAGRWSQRFNRGQRIQLGIGGMIGSVCFFIFMMPAAGMTPLPERLKQYLIVPLFMTLGTGWLFFGNVLQSALFGGKFEQMGPDHVDQLHGRNPDKP